MIDTIDRLHLCNLLRQMNIWITEGAEMPFFSTTQRIDPERSSQILELTLHLVLPDMPEQIEARKKSEKAMGRFFKKMGKTKKTKMVTVSNRDD